MKCTASRHRLDIHAEGRVESKGIRPSLPSTDAVVAVYAECLGIQKWKETAYISGMLQLRQI